MSRTLFRSTLLLIAIVVPRVALQADEPAQPTISGSGTVTLVGTSTYTGGTTINAGTLVVGNAAALGARGLIADGGTLDIAGYSVTVPSFNGAAGTVTGVGTLTLQGANTYTGGTTLSGGLLDVYSTGDNVIFDDTSPRRSGGIGGIAASAPTIPIPAGPVFYIITEGAGLGDSVRSVPCTGKETVLSAIGAVNGISQVSSVKIWIARPTPNKPDKSTILTIDWEAISKRGINTTNYTLMPGDRLVFGADPLTTRSNLTAKKIAPIERMNGIVGLTASTISGLKSTPGSGKFLKDLVQKGFITDDEEFKKIVLDAIGSDDGSKKSSPKATEELKPDQYVEKGSITFSGGVLIVTSSAALEPDQADKKSDITQQAVSHELAMQHLPAYRIEPPDVIAIELLKVVPMQPYRAEVYDVYHIEAQALPDHPIKKDFMVQADGTLDFGPPYGSVKVAGLTKDEIRKVLDKWLGQWLRDPAVHVQLSRVAGAQPVTGQYLVGPDGSINLRKYGRVAISGKTVAEARSAIEKQLKDYLEAPELSVDVVAYNSKVYYLITQGAGIGDNVRRLPVTGHETVLDAISQVNGLSQISSKNICIIRPLASDPEKATVLPVDWDAITSRGATATNYQLFPGDRIFIAEDSLITRTNLIGKKTAPLERLMGIVGLMTNTLKGLEGSSPATEAVLKELVRKGMITNDEEFKGILQEAIRLHALEREKAGPKAAGKGKPGK